MALICPQIIRTESSSLMSAPGTGGLHRREVGLSLRAREIDEVWG